jgi:hypothetical protein
MPTSAMPRGKTSELLVKAETSYGVAPSGNYTRTLFYSDTAGFKQPFEDDPIIGLARTNNRDTTEPAPGLVVNDPSIVVPVDYNHIGLWLNALFGAAVVTGAGDPYTHVFSSGGEVLPYRSHERKLATSLFFQDVGLLGNKLDISIGHEPGYQRATVSFLGANQSKLTSTGGGTPAAMWAREAVAAASGIFKINGAAAANLVKMSASYDNKGVPADYVSGNNLRSGVNLDDEATFMGSMELRFADSTYYDLAMASITPGGTTFSGEMLWTKSASRSLSILAANMRLEPVGIPISAAGKIQQSFSFRAEQSASAAMVVATLKSLVPSYSL